MNVYLRTDRLTLREFTEGDLAELIALNGDPKVMKFLTGGIPLTAEHICQEVLPRSCVFTRNRPPSGIGRQSPRTRKPSWGVSSSVRARTTAGESNWGFGSCLPSGEKGTRRRAAERS